jgi:hypothetical protein
MPGTKQSCEICEFDLWNSNDDCSCNSKSNSDKDDENYFNELTWQLEILQQKEDESSFFGNLINTQQNVIYNDITLRNDHLYTEKEKPQFANNFNYCLNGQQHSRCNPQQFTTKQSANKYNPIIEQKQLTIKQIIDQKCVVDVSLNQDGSKFIQNAFPNITQEEKQILFDQCYSEILNMSSHVFGNWIIQLFLDYGNEVTTQIIIYALIGHFKTLSFNIYGSRIVQKALTKACDKDKEIILTELNGKTIECIQNSNAYHVVQQ